MSNWFYCLFFIILIISFIILHTHTRNEGTPTRRRKITFYNLFKFVRQLTETVAGSVQRRATQHALKPVAKIDSKEHLPWPSVVQPPPGWDPLIKELKHGLLSHLLRDKSSALPDKIIYRQKCRAFVELLHGCNRDLHLKQWDKCSDFNKFK